MLRFDTVVFYRRFILNASGLFTHNRCGIVLCLLHWGPNLDNTHQNENHKNNSSDDLYLRI